MKIICIGRNYRDHIAEFDGGPLPAEPLFFLKPDTALLRNNDPFYIPDFTQEVHYECELVVRIDRLARHIAPRFAHRLYAEVGLGIDFTARDLQREAIANGWPWERAKGFDYSAAVAPQFVPVAELGDIRQLHFTLERRGTATRVYGRHDLRGGRTAEPRLALHHLPHGRPVFHRHAGGRRPRRTGRRAARHARRTRTVEFRNTLIP